jgi:PKD repeat protein
MDDPNNPQQNNKDNIPKESPNANNAKPVKAAAPAPLAKATTLPPGDGEKAKLTRKPKTGLLLSFMGLFLFLFVLFMVFLVVMLLQNGGNNPILGALGVEPALLKDLLTTLISLVFGFLSFVSFIVFLVALFRRFTATKIEVAKKKSSLILALISGGFLVLCIFLWLFLFFYITQLEVGNKGDTVILTEPAETINLTAPISITFDAIEIERLFVREGIVSFSWDLDGDGVFDDGNGRAIQFTYTDRGNDQGTYNVAVKVTLVDGQESVTEAKVTIANVLPRPKIEYSPKVLEVPVTVAFDASGSRDSEGEITKYEWDLDGDGSIDDNGKLVKFEYTTAQEIEVMLRVTDNNGESAEEKIPFVLRRGRTKEAVIITRPGEKGEVPFTLSFDASNSFAGDRIQSYEWDFGDGSALKNGRVVQYTYDTPGEYAVRLTVEGADGTVLETDQEIIAERATTTPKAVITLDDLVADDGILEGVAPFKVSFSAETSSDPDGEVVDYRWDFDDDGVSDAVGETAEYTFVDTGSFPITLTVIDDDDLTSSSVLIIEVTVPEVEVELEVSVFSGPVPLEINFDATASRTEEGKIISYTWIFGDESPEVIGSARQTHVFDEVGEYTVRVEVLTDTGKRGETDLIVVAREVELQADFTVNPETLTAEKKVFFDATQSQGQISRYYWEFGDSEISRVVKPEHIYDAPGEYMVILEVYDRKNRVSRKEIEVTVTAP